MTSFVSADVSAPRMFGGRDVGRVDAVRGQGGSHARRGEEVEPPGRDAGCRGLFLLSAAGRLEAADGVASAAAVVLGVAS